MEVRDFASRVGRFSVSFGKGRMTMDPGRPTMEGTARESPGLGRRVLVVDDDKSMRRLLADVLGSAGFEVAAAPDGPSGLALLRSSPVDLVLLDNNMPGMGGIEVIGHIRDN